MMIATIDRIYQRRYGDTGQVTVYVEWTDSRGVHGRTEGKPGNAHMQALIDRGLREGVRPTCEVW